MSFSFLRPNYPTEETEEESAMEDDAELTLSKVEEETTVGVPILLILFDYFLPFRLFFYHLF